MHFQSENYVPGVSGWKIDSETGRFEVNGHIELGGKSKSESKSGFDEAVTKGAQAVLDYLVSQISETTFVHPKGSENVQQTALIREEVEARANADEILGSRIGSLEAARGQPDPLFAVPVLSRLAEACEEGGKEQIVPMQRKSDDTKAFVVIDGTIYINNALVGAVFSSKEACVLSEQKPSLEEQVCEILKKQLRPGGLLWRSSLGR